MGSDGIEERISLMRVNEFEFEFEFEGEEDFPHSRMLGVEALTARDLRSSTSRGRTTVVWVVGVCCSRATEESARVVVHFVVVEKARWTKRRGGSIRCVLVSIVWERILVE